MFSVTASVCDGTAFLWRETEAMFGATEELLSPIDSVRSAFSQKKAQNRSVVRRYTFSVRRRCFEVGRSVFDVCSSTFMVWRYTSSVRRVRRVAKQFCFGVRGAAIGVRRKTFAVCDHWFSVACSCSSVRRCRFAVRLDRFDHPSQAQPGPT